MWAYVHVGVRVCVCVCACGVCVCTCCVKGDVFSAVRAVYHALYSASQSTARLRSARATLHQFRHRIRRENHHLKGGVITFP